MPSFSRLEYARRAPRGLGVQGERRRGIKASSNMSLEGPLPVVDAGSILQEESIQAFRAALPPAEYLFRDERTDDYGVDGALELRSDGKATNIRAQIQLKGRSNTRENAGGAIAVSVTTSNLNYLLNGICPIYVLYRPENKELRAAFARDEWARLERENPSWREQGTVTIYFKDVVVPETLAQLRSRIVEDATVQRSVNERLNAVRGTAAQVVVHAESLTVVDSAQAVELLARIGQALTNAGLARAVIDKGRTVPTAMLLATPRAALAVAYAHFHLAQYYDASAALRQLLLTNPGWAQVDKSLADMLFIATRRMLGDLDQAGYEREMSGWSKDAPEAQAAQHQIGLAWSRHLAVLAASPTEGERTEMLSALRTAFERGRAVGDEYINFHIELLELTLEQGAAEDALIDAEAITDISARGFGDAHHAREVAKASRSQAKVWFDKLTDLANKTRVSAPSRYCEVRLLHGHAVLANAGRTQLAARTGYGTEVAKATIDSIFEALEETLRLARALEHRDLELTALQNLARALDTFDRPDEATTVGRDALRMAELTGCSIHARQLRTFLDGSDRFAARLRQLTDFNAMSEEDIMRSAGDDQLSFMANRLAEANQIPMHRVPNILRDLQCQRQFAIERHEWCRELVYAQFQRGIETPLTLFAEPPRLKVVCARFNYEAAATAPNVADLTAKFRQQFCRRCSHRLPGSGELVGLRGVRNRAKADRRARHRGR